LSEILDEVSSEEEAEAVHEFVESDEYEDWLLAPFEDEADLVAIPSLTKKLKEMGLDNVVAWMLVNDIPRKKIEKLARDATLDCLKAGEYVGEILELAKKYYRVEKDTSRYSKTYYSGKVVYRVYDGDELVGAVTLDAWYCNSCMCSEFVDFPGCNANFIEKCVAWYFGEPKDEE
jgi:hypothetical protein